MSSSHHPRRSGARGRPLRQPGPSPGSRPGCRRRPGSRWSRPAQGSLPRAGDEAGPWDEPLVGGVERLVGAVELTVVEESSRKRTWASPAGVCPGSTSPPQPASSSVAPSATRNHLTPRAMIAHRRDGRLRPVEAPQRKRSDRARGDRVHEQEHRRAGVRSCAEAVPGRGDPDGEVEVVESAPEPYEMRVR